jgi:hypothetical protein
MALNCRSGRRALALALSLPALGGCASARSLAAENVGAPLHATAPTAALLVVGEARADVERSFRVALGRSDRVRLRPAEQTRQAWNPPTDASAPTVEEACDIGRRLQVESVIIATAHASVSENSSCVATDILSKNGRCVAYRKDGTYSGSVSADVRILATWPCRQQLALGVSGGTDGKGVHDSSTAADLAHQAFERNLARALPEAFPIGARVTASDGTRGRIPRGSNDGVRHGQVLGVMRGDTAAGHVVVDDVRSRSADVVAFTGDVTLRRGDLLAESGTTCCLELTPVAVALGADVGGRRRVGGGGGLRVDWYQPLGSLLISSTLARVSVGDGVATNLWTAGAGWMWRISERGSRLYALLGGGVEDSRSHGLHAEGVLGQLALGAKLRLSDNFWFDGEAGWQLGTRMESWGSSSPPPYVDLGGPLARAGVGLRIP